MCIGGECRPEPRCTADIAISQLIAMWMEQLGLQGLYLTAETQTPPGAQGYFYTEIKLCLHEGSSPG